MKELTKKQKLDFILYCMEKINEEKDHFFTCHALGKFFTGKSIRNYEAIQLFPELDIFLQGHFIFESDTIAGESYDSYYKKSNKLRSIIYSFLYLHLLDEINLN